MHAGYSYIGSLDDAVGDFEPREDPTDSMIDNIFMEEVYSSLDTTDEKEIVSEIIDEKNFLEISRDRGLRESQVYSMKRNLSKKLSHLVSNKKNEGTAVAVMLYLTAKLRQIPTQVYARWDIDPVLKDYRKPTKKMIEDYLEDLILRLGGGMVVYRIPKRKKQLYPTEKDTQLTLF